MLSYNKLIKLLIHMNILQKNDDFRYANGPSYCISEALMFKVEKYLRYTLHNKLIKPSNGSSIGNV